MTAKQPTGAELYAAQESMARDRVLRVSRARRLEAAAGAQNRPNSSPVQHEERPDDRVRPLWCLLSCSGPKRARHLSGVLVWGFGFPSGIFGRSDMHGLHGS